MYKPFLGALYKHQSSYAVRRYIKEEMKRGESENVTAATEKRLGGM